ncbi:MAG TPA: endonuclease/exonuclease/phosphatase family protein [Alphaproteobacteria bacterium]|jgi:endonuclease/exonuclease/phosphatase family metal-dependent hydrolase|nr:endonuclease/exonuclease/phosphatase family protein [Alphaproteobacteria bacterium]
MRIIFLNCYSGQLKIPLFDFIQKQAANTDIFCFQEVSESLQVELQKLLKNFSHVFEIGFMLSDVNELAGQAIFFNKKVELIKSEKILLHELKTKDIGFLLKAKLKVDNKEFLLGNVHGTAAPGTKVDSELRLNQSQIIIDAFKNENNFKIIGGDFNLLRNTKSIHMFENEGYKNLIKDFNIKATRNKVAWERFKDEPGFVKQYDSDFCFVSKEIKVTNFEVPDVEISDHLPLILDLAPLI